MKKWEYHILDLRTDDPKCFKSQLNIMGQAGWKLFEICPTYCIFYRRFRKPKEEKQIEHSDWNYRTG